MFQGVCALYCVGMFVVRKDDGNPRIQERKSIQTNRIVFCGIIAQQTDLYEQTRCLCFCYCFVGTC